MSKGLEGVLGVRLGEGLLAGTRFADSVLRLARDRYGPEPTPLWADEIGAESSPAREAGGPGLAVVSCNLALQQDFLRTLVALSRLTGTARYAEAAASAVAFHCDHFASPCGLLRWGGHQCINLCAAAPVAVGLDDCHELKSVYPFYELMAEVRPTACARFVRAFWNAHVLDWTNLDMNRHGPYGKPGGTLWASRYAEPSPFFPSDGLSFLNAGSDLVYAASALAHMAQPDGAAALLWAIRLDQLYVRARDRRTGLGVYQYSSPRERRPPLEGSTLSIYGDRAKRQLGPEYGRAALEGNVLTPAKAEMIYGRHALIQLQLAEALGPGGLPFLSAAVTGLHACARHLLDADTGRLRPMLADGTDLSGVCLVRDGYYGKAGTVLRPRTAGAILFWAYALAHRLTGDEHFWRVTRALAAHRGLGDLGRLPGTSLALAGGTVADHEMLYAILEVYRTCPHPAYLAQAQMLANTLAEWLSGMCRAPGEGRVRGHWGAPAALAVLALEATLRGAPDMVPRHRGSRLPCPASQ